GAGGVADEPADATATLGQRAGNYCVHHARDAEQGDRIPDWHDRAGGEELSAQGVRQTGCERPAGTGAVLPSSPDSQAGDGGGGDGVRGSGRAVAGEALG